MLEYEPIWLHKFHQDTKEAGIKCNLAQVLKSLDVLHVQRSAQKFGKLDNEHTLSTFPLGATIPRSPLHLFPHGDEKTK